MIERAPKVVITIGAQKETWSSAAQDEGSKMRLAKSSSLAHNPQILFGRKQTKHFVS
jgi:hypothetical protein